MRRHTGLFPSALKSAEGVLTMAKKRGTMVALLLALSAQPTHAESWSAWEVQDEMDGRVRKGAASSWTPPTRDQPFPFRGLKGVAGFTCSGERPLFYFRFSETPNLIDDEIHDSFNESRTRIKFDEGHPKQITLLQMWGSPSLRVNTYRNVNLGGWNHTPDPKWLQEVSTSSEMLIELPWYSPCLSGCNPHPLYVGCAVIRQARVSEWKLMF